MPVAALRFETCWTIPFPVATIGHGTGLTVCLRHNDPCLAFLTQIEFVDEIVYLALVGGELHRDPTPPGHDTISGLAYDPFRRVIWCAQSTQDPDTLLAINPDTGLQTTTCTAVVTPNQIYPHGLGCNGFFFCRCGSGTLELWLTNGLFVGARDYPGRIISGISASPWSWSFVDRSNDEIVVIGPFGSEIGVSSGAGAAGGMEALAFDYVTHHQIDSHPQVWLENGTIGDPGTIHHPDTPWSPEPWNGRHRLYVANQADQTIYAGYLTAD